MKNQSAGTNKRIGICGGMIMEQNQNGREEIAQIIGGEIKW